MNDDKHKDDDSPTLEESHESRYYAAFTEAFDAMLIADDDGYYIDANQSACELFGLEIQDLIGRHISDFAPEDYDFAEAWEHFQNSQTLRGTFPLVRGNGERRTVEYAATSDIAPGEHLSILRDITEREKQTEQLNREREFQDQILETLDDIFFVLDQNGRLQQWNAEAIEVTGYSPAEIDGKDALEFFEGPDVDRVAESIEETLQTGSSAVEAKLLTNQGDRIQYEFRASKWTDCDGDLRGIVGIGRDISERAERERIINELHGVTQGFMQAETREEVAQVAVQAVREVLGMQLTSVHLAEKNGTRLRPVAWTDRTTEVIGDIPTFRPGDGLAWNVFETGEIGVFNDLRSVPDVLNPNTKNRSEVILPLGDYGVLLVGSTEPNQFDEVDVRLLEIVATNLETALERADREEELRTKKNELEHQNERLNEFSSIVSHDLRNPLSVAMGRIELAQSEVQNPNLEKASAALDRMKQLIEDLLRLAKEGENVTEIDSVALPQIVERCWANVSTKSATLDIKDNVVLRADPDRFQQLLENLFRNAIEHDGGDVTVTIGELDDDSGIYIEDNGLGIPEDQRERIFKSGYSTNPDGTGFGLAIVKQIATAHGWKINATEGSSGGARFEIIGVEFDTK